MGVFASIRDFTTDLSPVWLVMLFASPYVAGEKLEDAVKAAHSMYEKDKLWATLDILGESSDSAERSREWAKLYFNIQTKISDIPSANVSLKPTAMGLLLSEEECLRNIRSVVSKSKKINRFVRIDMEDKTTTDATFRIYRQLRDDGFDNVGVVVQAYLKRTIEDIRLLIERGYKPNIRICKGIYKADREFKTMAQINDSFVAIARLLVENGCYPAFATHDVSLIDRLHNEVITPASYKPEQYEWQMLLGVPVRKKRSELLKNGEHVRIYIPYGPKADAAAYCRRRFKENPKLALFIAKNFICKK